MVNFPIYVLGDATSFYSVINSVAMVFSAKSFILSTQLAAGLIALVACVAGLLGKMAGDSKMGQHPVTTPLMFGAMVAFMSIPSSVTVQDIYTGSTVKVDNVPVLISAPASLFTTGAYKLFDTANTSFQTVNGSYMGVSTSGFVMPLKLLLSLRSGIDKADPYLSASVSQFIIDCIPGSTTFNLTNTAGGFGRSEDAIKYIVDNARPSGLTTYYTANATAGTATACQNAGQLLLTDSAKFYNSPQFVDMINSGLKEKNPNDPNGLYKLSDLESAITNVGQIGGLVAGSQQDTRAYALNAMFYHRINDTFRCLDSVGSQKDFNTCTMALNQAFEKWKAEAVSNGTFFAKMMTPAIVFLQLMFFGFAPIVILYSLFKGAGSLGLYIKYLGFGVWTSSWLPFSAIIQMYIQNNVADKLMSIQAKHPGILTPATFDATFNDIIGTRLALASDLLAATPMLSLALLSGSIYSLSSLANKWNGQGHTDPNLVTPPVQSASPVFASSSANVNRLTRGYVDEGGEQNTMSFAITNASQEASSLSRRVSESNAALQSVSNAQSVMTQNQFATAYAKTAQQMDQSQKGIQFMDGGVTFSKGSEKAVTLSQEESKALAEQTKGALSLTSGITGALIGGLTKKFNGKLSEKQAAQATEKAIDTIARQDAGLASRLFSPDEGARTTAWKQVADKAIDIADAAMVAGTAIAVGTEIATGAGALAAPATAAAGMAARTSMKKALIAGGAADGLAKGVSSVIGAAKESPSKLKKANGQQLTELLSSNTEGGARAAAELSVTDSDQFKTASAAQKKDAISVVANWGYNTFHGSSTTNSNTDSKAKTETHTIANGQTLANTYQEAASRIINAEDAYMKTSTSGTGEATQITVNPQQMVQRLNSNPQMVEDIQKQVADWKQKDHAKFEAARKVEEVKGKWQMGNHFNEPTKEFLTDLATLRRVDPNFKLFDSGEGRSDANAGIEKAQGPDTKKIHDQVKDVAKVATKAAESIKVGDVDKKLAGKVNTGAVAPADISPSAVVNAAFNPGNHASRTLAAAATDTSPVIVEGMKLDAQRRGTELQAPEGDKPAAMRTEKQMIGAAAFGGFAINAAAHRFHNPMTGDGREPGSAGTGTVAQQGQPPAAGTSAPQPGGSANPAQSSPARPSRPARQGKPR
jgi:conjugal transfer mating pair stabilization protein TraG